MDLKFCNSDVNKKECFKMSVIGGMTLNKLQKHEIV